MMLVFCWCTDPGMLNSDDCPLNSFFFLPTFSCMTFKSEKLSDLFGSLTMERYVRPFLDEPRVIESIKTLHDHLYNVVCLSDEKIWTWGQDNIMRLYNLYGEQLYSIQTKSGDEPSSIGVTKSGDLIYIDNNGVSIANKSIETVISLSEWIPCGVCSSSSGNLLIIMDRDDFNQTKVVRFSDSKEKRSIQFNDNGKPLYSSGPFFKYIEENRNFDICVSDYKAGAIVVVNQDGKFRFTYTGPPSSKTKGGYLNHVASQQTAKIES